MGTVTYAYEPEQAVWVITGGNCPPAVREGIVQYVRIDITSDTGSPISNIKIVYDIILSGDNGPTKFLEADVFGTLPAASTEYQTRMQPTATPK